MSNRGDNNKFINESNFIKFNLDKPFKMFVGEMEGKKVKNISKDELEGFKDGDKVVVMHGEDWVWFIDELLKYQGSD